MLVRRKGSPGAPRSGFFGGRGGKSGRGRKKEETSFEVRRKKAREAPKLKRAGSPLLPEEGGRAGGAAGSASGNRWSAGVRPWGLAGKRQSGGFRGNPKAAAGSEEGPEGRSP